jgi:Arf-GAP/GTPase/ANK repeat/PH domain-containing protein 1/3
MQEESPEGGRFKKEILVDNQSYLLLIRDEGGPPELQVLPLSDPLLRKSMKNANRMRLHFV